MKRFIGDVKKYYKYAIFAGKAELKSEVASSHLSWMWWILDPLLFMLVYSFVSLIVFGRAEEYFSAFIFIGYSSFKFFEKTLKASVNLVSSNKNVIKNIYIPKHILLLSKMVVTGFQYAIAFLLVLGAMAIYRVPLTWHVIQFVPQCLLLVMITFAFSTVLMNFGVYVEDLSNIISVVLRLAFYMSGVFYSLPKRIKEEWLRTLLLKFNPVAFIIDQMREALLFGGPFRYKVYTVWFCISIIVSVIGLRLIYKNENSYAKVI